MKRHHAISASLLLFAQAVTTRADNEPPALTREFVLTKCDAVHRYQLSLQGLDALDLDRLYVIVDLEARDSDETGFAPLLVEVHCHDCGGKLKSQRFVDFPAGAGGRFVYALPDLSGRVGTLEVTITGQPEAIKDQSLLGVIRIINRAEGSITDGSFRSIAVALSGTTPLFYDMHKYCLIQSSECVRSQGEQRL